MRDVVRCFLLLAATGAALSLSMGAQNRAADPSVLPSPVDASLGANSPVPAVRVSVSRSYVSLNGPWRFAPGDSPWSGGTFLWSRPEFDDSRWGAMELRPAAGAVNLGYGDSGYVPGWTSLGYPRLSGFAWYRIRIHMIPGDKPLAIVMPDHVDDAYQVFANGQFLGQMGRFESHKVICYRTQPKAFVLPAPDAAGDVEVAVRFYMEPWVQYMSANVGSQGAQGSGGMHGVPVVGLAPAAWAMVQEHMRQRVQGIMSAGFVSLLMVLAAGAAFCFWIMERRDGSYLWAALALMTRPAATLVSTVGLFSQSLDQDTGGVLFVLAISSGLACWIVFWREWFGLGRNRRMYGLLAALLAVQVAIYVWVFEFSGHSDARLILGASQAAAACEGVLGILMLLTLAPAWRKDRVGALLALGPVLLVIVDSFSLDIHTWLDLPTEITLQSGFHVGVGDVAGLLAVLVVAVLAGRRFLHARIEERLERHVLDQELEQARELQQHVLIPGPVHSGVFAVETAYHPARVVGGDFFQAIPIADGSLLIVVGDVSGKGIAAAMLVAVLVGSIRTRAEETSSPAALLATLNQRLLGRSGGHFATCIAAHLRPDGTLTLANAGHLAPYRNGQETELDFALPLGITDHTGYTETVIKLFPGETLTFLSDGVVEAQSATGELFGFERTRQISTQSAEAIAAAAQAFGQEDDITVLTLTFAPVEVLHA
jgi:hypothetical protein